MSSSSIFTKKKNVQIFKTYLVSHFVSHHEGHLGVPPLEPGHEVVNDDEGVIIRFD